MPTNFSNFNLTLDEKLIDRIGNSCPEKSFKFVGHHLDEHLSWDFHIKHLISKLSSANYAIGRSKNFLPQNIRKTLYNSMFGSHLNFGLLSYGCGNKSKLKKIITLQKKAIRHVANVGYRAHTEPIFSNLEILKFGDLHKYNILNFMHKFSRNLLPASFNGTFTLARETEDVNIRDSFYNYQINVPTKKMLECFPSVTFPLVWNALSSEQQSTESHKVFKNDCKKYLLNTYSEFAGCDDLSCAECRNIF